MNTPGFLIIGKHRAIYTPIIHYYMHVCMYAQIKVLHYVHIAWEVKGTDMLQNYSLGSIFLKAFGTHVKSLQESLNLHDSPYL